MREYKPIIATIIISIALVVSAIIISNAIIAAGGDIGSQIASAINQNH